ncbi:hypothetical protein ES702_00538 [subsurface metagenome]
MTYQVADYQSEEGRSFPYVFLSTSGQSPESSTNSSNKLKTWVQGAVHGNEPAGDQSILALIGKMDANQTWTQSILETMDILILPRYNPDGVGNFQVRRLNIRIGLSRNRLCARSSKNLLMFEIEDSSE